jgi:DNA-binding transcriptional MerR regulator
MEPSTLSLFEVAAKLGVSPSAVKKRVANLNIPVERGARGKLIFDERAWELLARADELLKAGHGFEECRKRLGLHEAPEALAPRDEAAASAEAPAEAAPPAPAEQVARVGAVPAATEAAPVAAAGASESASERVSQVASVAVAEPAVAPMPLVSSAPATASVPAVAEAAVPLAPVASVVSVGAGATLAVPSAPVVREALAALEAGVAAEATGRTAAAEPEKMRPLNPPVFIQLGRKRPAPPAEPEAPALPPDLLHRLDAALKLLEEKEKQNQTLQSKLMVAYDEMTKLSATAAAFQERSLNLQHEVQKLQGELKLLAAPAERKPWWRFWG